MLDRVVDVLDAHLQRPGCGRHLQLHAALPVGDGAPGAAGRVADRDGRACDRRVRAGRVEVDFSELRNRRISDNQVCDVIVHLKRNFVKAHAAASEPAAALDLVLDKVEHQVARIKEKRVTRTHAHRRNRAATGEDGALSAPDGGIEAEDDDDVGIVNRIVKTKRSTMKPMGPEEAALQMDLLGHEFFLFTNAENGHAAVLYRRRDGNLGLIETTG